MIFDHYLAIQCWDPNFDPDVATINRVAAWVRSSYLAMEYFDEIVLMTLGN